MKFDDVVIILQGYSVNDNQMEELVRYYKNSGFDNIVVSSYDSCLNKYVKENTVFIANDSIENGEVLSITTNNKSSHERGITGKEFNVRSDEIIPQIPGSNLNYHILTTKRGVNLAKEIYPQCDYYLKLRADQKLENLNEFIPRWKQKIDKPPNDIFKKKLLTLGWGKNKQKVCWYISDYWTFGYKDDIINYYNIPYNTDKRIISHERYIAYKFVSTKVGSEHFRSLLSSDHTRDPNFENFLKENWAFDNSIKNFSYKWECYVNNKTACKLQ